MDSKPKVALCSGCMNWTKYLNRASQTWVEKDVFSSMTIVDWSSKKSFVDILRKHDHKSNILRIDGKKEFSITKVRNTAIRFALRSQPDYIMFVDADMMFIDSLDLSILNKKTYFHGVRHSTGTAIYPSEYFMILNGYNETIRFRSSDHEFYRQLGKRGLEVRKIGLIDKMLHIKHPLRGSKKILLEDGYMPTVKWIREGIMELQECIIYHPDGSITKEIV